MPRRYTSQPVLCPFYKNEQTQCIYCDAGDGVTIRVTASSFEKLKQIKKICRGNYKECKVYKGVSE